MMETSNKHNRINYLFIRAIDAILMALLLAGLLGVVVKSAPLDQTTLAADLPSNLGDVPDTSGPAGTWYFNANHFALTVTIAEISTGTYQGTLVDETVGTPELLDNITWDLSTRRLEFRRGPRQWYRGTIVDGIFVGRFSHNPQSSARPTQLTSYVYHVTGWNSTYIDRDLAPRVYEVLSIGSGFHGRLRIDRSPDNPNQFIGRLKYYGTVSRQSEELEYDVEVTQWDGTNLQFIRRGPGMLQVYTGIARGRNISGTFTKASTSRVYAWRGTRAEALSYGLAGKSPDERAAWQVCTRRRLYHLLMGDNPAPLTRSITALTAPQPPIASLSLPAYRDDDPLNWTQNYLMTELRFDYTLPNPYAGPPLTRQSHGYLGVPTTAPLVNGKYPAVVAVNGHGSSAYRVMNPDEDWYGDAFARRGFVVLAVDISHRPVEDLRGSNADRSEGDDPTHGNGPHPAIKAPGFDSDWEVDGERAWDVMRAVDYLLTLPYVDANRILITGLSMGGEVTTIAGALDPRFSLVLPAGYSTDLGLLTFNDHRCWEGLNSNIRDYMDMSDFHALIAPRPLIVETGRKDNVFSLRPRDPFASDKQVTRRSRIAYGDDVRQFVHYLHYDVHHYHVGDANPTSTTEQGVRVPLVIAPGAPGSLSWQSDPTTSTDGATLFDLVVGYLYP